MTIKVGCCGFPRAKNLYFAQFKVVEIQQTFYKPPGIETAEKWRSQAPSDFEFTLKAWQLITHSPKSPTYRKAKLEILEAKVERYGSFRSTDEVFAAWEQTKAIAQTLKSRIVVFQSPASFTPTDENKRNMRSFFNAIDRGNFVFVWEPRGEWKDIEIEQICEQLDLIEAVDPFLRETAFGQMNYFRLHGKGGYRYRFTNQDLVQLRKRCKEKELTYCMFNNVFMYEDALRFSEFKP